MISTADSAMEWAAAVDRLWQDCDIRHSDLLSLAGACREFAGVRLATGHGKVPGRSDAHILVSADGEWTILLSLTTGHWYAPVGSQT